MATAAKNPVTVDARERSQQSCRTLWLLDQRKGPGKRQGLPGPAAEGSETQILISECHSENAHTSDVKVTLALRRRELTSCLV